MSNPIYIIGHRNPDTDASTSASAYAGFLNAVERYDGQVIPAVCGPLTPQARWVFQQAGVEAPTLIETFSPRVRDVMHSEPIHLTQHQRLGEAVDKLIRTGHSMLPVVNDDGQLVSVFSNREDVSRFLMGFDVVPMAATLLTWSDVVEMPGMSVVPNDKTIESDSDCGNLVIALSGDDVWSSTISQDDILICGNASILSTVSADRRPNRIVIINDQTPVTADIQHLIETGTQILHFSGSVSDFLRSLTLQIRLESLAIGRGACIGADDLLVDVRHLIESSRRAVPVVGDNDNLIGVVARGDLKAPPKRRAILIDHFESSQAVAGFEFLELIEVVDHHRIGNIETPAPCRVDCRPIGSSCSIVALNYFEANREPDKANAILLLGGLCADTLALKGPTTTGVDRHIAERLAKIAGVNIDEFGKQVLKAGDDLLTANPADIWKRDQKVFGIRNHHFAVAQLETVALDDLPTELLDEFRQELARDFASCDYLSSLLVVTDVLTRNSWITSLESPAVQDSTQSAFGSSTPKPDWIEARDVVSRKKQIIPQLMQTYAELSL